MSHDMPKVVQSYIYILDKGQVWGGGLFYASRVFLSCRPLTAAFNCGSLCHCSLFLVPPILILFWKLKCRILHSFDLSGTLQSGFTQHLQETDNHIISGTVMQIQIFFLELIMLNVECACTPVYWHPCYLLNGEWLLVYIIFDQGS